MKKLTRNIIIPQNEPRFVQKSIFIYKAKSQNWTKHEINLVLAEANDKSDQDFLLILRKYCQRYSI